MDFAFHGGTHGGEKPLGVDLGPREITFSGAWMDVLCHIGCDFHSTQ